MQAFPSSASMFNFESNLLGDARNGSGFNFKCVKSGLTKNLSVDYNNVNFNTRTLTNCSTIDTINTTITNNYNTLNTDINNNDNTVLTKKVSYAKCRIVRDTTNYTLSWQYGFRTFVSSGLYISVIGTLLLNLCIDVNTDIDSINFVVNGGGFVEMSHVSIAESLTTRLLLRNSSRVVKLSAIET
jgi:hypothetical protein